MRVGSGWGLRSTRGDHPNPISTGLLRSLPVSRPRSSKGENVRLPTSYPESDDLFRPRGSPLRRLSPPYPSRRFGRDYSGRPITSHVLSLGPWFSGLKTWVEPSRPGKILGVSVIPVSRTTRYSTGYPSPVFTTSSSGTRGGTLDSHLSCFVDDVGSAQKV